MTEADPKVLVERRGHLGLLTLNRPASINALDHDMVITLAEQLEAWRTDDRIAVVAITGAGERGLCAGGDIVSLYRDATSGDGDASLRYWRDEYTLDATIAAYPKPYVAIQDGLVLGGGVGVSAHGSHRIATERTRLGLPETGIGFVPDVGASWLLSRAPGESGTRLALTAATIGAADAIYTGFSDVMVPSARIPDLLRDLESGDVDEVVAFYAQPVEEGILAADAAWVDEAFGADTVPAITAALDALRTESAAKLATTIRAKSPTAVAVALESLRRARALTSLEEALDTEYRVSVRAFASADFTEGIRAQVIDKDRDPHWRPGNSDDVDPSVVAHYFDPLEAEELGLSTRRTKEFR